jgi:hypothetical protein
MRISQVRSKPNAWRFANADAGGYADSSALANLVNYYAKLLVLEKETWDALAVRVTVVSTAGGLLRLALYGDLSGYGEPGGAIYADLGTQVTTAVATLVYPFPSARQMNPGVYHVGVKLEGNPTTKPQLHAHLSNTPPGTTISAYGTVPTAGGNQYSLSQAAGAFPDPAPAASYNGNWRPVVWARVLSRP